MAKCEVPRTDACRRRKPWRHGRVIFIGPVEPAGAASWRDGRGFNAIARFDIGDGRVDGSRYAGEHSMPMEPQFSPRSVDAPEGDDRLPDVVGRFEGRRSDPVVVDALNLASGRGRRAGTTHPCRLPWLSRSCEGTRRLGSHVDAE